MKKLRVGTRKSLLSARQTELALAALAKVHPALETEIVPFHTRGDLILDKPLWAISNQGKGVFASEFEEMLLRDEIDIAIHSGKDLPVLLADGLEIIGVLKRDDPRDVLVMPKGKKAEACKIIGTGSLRREQCAAKVFPWAECRLIRGNIQTRLQKLKDGEYDAILLAKAGLDRMGITEADGYAFRVLSPEEFLPAACQGIIVAEGKRELSSFVGAMTHLETQYIFETERAVLRLLGADCSAPVAAFAEMEGEVIRLRAMYGEGRCRGQGTRCGAFAAGGGGSREVAEMSGTVYLVGAGCGNPDLITWKGLRLLRACDAVLYDDLSSPKLLEETRTDCERLFVGKRYGRHSMPQAEINALLVAKAQEGKTVVRLKGGDPFVFGRGGEEVLALQAAGIPYEVVSGVSSAVAVPAAAGIPVTHRRLARSFHVITGHTAADGAETLTEQIDTLAKLEGTLVFLMGLHHLEEITNGLLQGGKPADTPAAVISEGTTPKQRVVRAKLCNLAAKTRKANLAAPAVIVIGETAGMQLSGTIEYPLYGVKIGVTGTKSITKKLRNRLEELGATVTELDYATLVPDWENEALEQALQSITADTWAVFTSPNGVEIFFQALQKRRIDIRTLAQLRFAVIGTGTAAALEKRGIYPAFLPKTYDVESLAKGLCSVVGADEKILILRAAQGSPVLTEILAKEKKQYTDVKLYDIAIDAEKRRFAHEAAKEMDFITFASGSGVRGFFAQGGTMPQGTTAVCIGTSTAKTLASYGDFPALTAQTFNVDGIIEVILEEASKTKTTEKETDK